MIKESTVEESSQRVIGWWKITGKFYRNGFVRCKANDSSGCRFPYVTRVRYRSNSVSIRLWDWWQTFSGSGKCFFVFIGIIIHHFIVNTGWHHENNRPGHSEKKFRMSGFLFIRSNYSESLRIIKIDTSCLHISSSFYDSQGGSNRAAAPYMSKIAAKQR